MDSDKHFDQISDNYNTTLNHAINLFGEGWVYFSEYKALIIKKILSPNFSGKILEYGCGIGNNLRTLKKFLPDAKLHGYDPSDGSLSKVDSEIRSQGLFSSDLKNLGKDYDCIFVSNVFHHIVLNSHQSILGQLRGLLSPHGKLVVIEHNPCNPFTLYSVRNSPIDVEAKLISLRSFKKRMRISNFERVTSRYIVFFPKILKFLRRFEDNLGWCPLGAQYVLVGEKGKE